MIFFRRARAGHYHEAPARHGLPRRQGQFNPHQGQGSWRAFVFHHVQMAINPPNASLHASAFPRRSRLDRRRMPGWSAICSPSGFPLPALSGKPESSGGTQAPGESKVSPLPAPGANSLDESKVPGMPGSKSGPSSKQYDRLIFQRRSLFRINVAARALALDPAAGRWATKNVVGFLAVILGARFRLP
jgi:hypothetical protein